LPERAGRWVASGRGTDSYKTFIPAPLPPSPAIVLDAARQRRLERASIALGRLDGIGRLLPGPEELLYSYLRKEAVLSSQIEGTQSSLADLLLHEHEAVPGVPLHDVSQVSNYVAALTHGIDLLKKLPLSLRVLREIHQVLLAGLRGADRAAGEFRRVQNWIGGSSPNNAVFVPPPANEVLPALGQLERFINDDTFPVLLRAAMAHAQFETIHPFLDGNGRVGRMLIPLLFVADGQLERPWLYISLYFKTRRQQYYMLLQAVRTDGDWEAWIDFFLEAVTASAENAERKIRDLQLLFERDRASIAAARGGSIYQQAAVQTNLEVFEHLRRRMAVSIPAAATTLGRGKPTVARALAELTALGIAREATGHTRNRVFVYDNFLKTLERD
jgi:Fic family protein